MPKRAFWWSSPKHMKLWYILFGGGLSRILIATFHVNFNFESATAIDLNWGHLMYAVMNTIQKLDCSFFPQIHLSSPKMIMSFMIGHCVYFAKYDYHQKYLFWQYMMNEMTNDDPYWSTSLWNIHVGRLGFRNLWRVRS